MGTRGPAHSGLVDEIVLAARAALGSGQLEEAVNQFRRALKSGARSPEQEASIRCDLSETLGKQGLGREQLDVLSKYSTQAALSRLSDKTRMRICVRLGWALSLNNDVPRAIAFFDQAMRIARQAGDDAGIGSCYMGLGRAYRNLSEIQIARDQYVAALEHFRKVGDWRQLAEAHVSVGHITAFEGNYRNALHSLDQALAIVGDRAEYELRGRANMYVAISSDNLGLTQKALDAWAVCIESFRRAGNTLYLAINENNLAMKLIGLGHFSRAEDLIRSSIQGLRETTAVASLGGALDTLAQLNLIYGRTSEAEQLLKESLGVLSSVKTGEWAEVSTRTTLARCALLKGHPGLAIDHLRRAIEICLRSGTHYLLAEARLWLAEAYLAKNDREAARQVVDEVFVELRSGPNLVYWAFLMRVSAKIEAADGHTAAAIQSLRQSTSIYELRENPYHVAQNRVELARLYQAQGQLDGAAVEYRNAIAEFERLSASGDAARARAEIAGIEDSLPRQDGGGPVAAASTRRGPDLASAVDGFIARRLVYASVSRELLLYELASIARGQACSRAVLVAEGPGDDGHGAFSAEASIGLTEVERSRELDFLARVEDKDREKNFVYPFTDNVQSKFLLHIIEPTADRFRSGTVNLHPLLHLVEQGLEAQALRSKTRRTQIFDPAKVLSDSDVPGFVCGSRAMSRVLEQIHKIRSSNVTILITGESGTGKELVARALHGGSSRKCNVFLPFNCSAAPRDMVESQLFGYRRGAFTGAVSNYDGIIRAAERGTLFLDEVGDLPLDVQPKLLRFLQEGEIHPLGEPQPIHVDVRIIAATNSDLERGVEQGKFREDLFHRLNVIRVHIPPLRERREDIPALVNHYLRLYQQEAAKTGIKLTEEVVDLMVVYDWPGNVRQLCNEMRRIVTYSDSNSIAAADLLSREVAGGQSEGLSPARGRRSRGALATLTIPIKTTLPEAVTELERRMIKEALERSSGNIARAAKELGLSRKGLYLKMDRLKFNE